ncbi:hypothetical protein DEJ33_04875 [Curtobacterium sp. MCPF17_047]|uniref:PIN domain-containing protein n=1 Tax=unclassified Curtobacterium TaxID=257496 RepID=UPI000DA8B647|nr:MULTISPECIES: PIN domain-containing protein [unclassified Curtobacterium]PZE60374.1 hypothetical protein DEJ24_06535 [Curtobacterium sp. MCPF17_001]PZF67795.1 hypothetical protein DEJ33_04875 [Curtobacterium sp. MCPF17_047]
MLIVVLDTNAVHRDPWLTRDVAPKLIQLAASEVCEIVYPQVVIKELTRQRIESAREALDSAAAGVEQMGAAGINVAETVTLLQNAHDRIESDIDNAFVEVLAKPGVRDVPVPEVKTTDLLGRDLGRRRPFLEIEQGKTRKSLGFRDVLIWESVLEVLQTSNSGDTVLFVTFDGGFIADDKKSLHADLLEDLDGFGIPRERIRLARGVPEAISLIEDLVADTVSQPSDHAPETMSPSRTPDDAQGERSAVSEGAPAPDEPELPAVEDLDDTAPGGNPVEIAVDELKQDRPGVSRAALVEAATDALYGLVNEDVSEQLAYGGDYEYPSFVKFTVPLPEGGTIAAIDQTTEFSFKESEQSADVLVGTAEAVITIEGGLYRGDWFEVEGAVSISGQLSDHYLDASAEVEVEVRVEIDIEGGETNVLDIVLEDLPTPPVNGADQLEFDFFDVDQPDAGDERPSDESEAVADRRGETSG